MYDDQGRYAKAEPLFKRVLAIHEKVLGPENPEVATALNNLAVLYHDQDGYAEAERLHKRALAIREKALGPDHPDLASSFNNLALVYIKRRAATLTLDGSTRALSPSRRRPLAPTIRT
jgi:tetratricopeptide (TPR) repeat protein